MTDTVTSITKEKTVPLRSHISPYIIVAKPGIVAFVLVSTLSGMYMANHGLPGSMLILWTLFGVGLSTAGAAALNNYIDRDIDLVMRRTSGRPIPAGLGEPLNVLIYGLCVSILSGVVTWLLLKLPTALL